MLAGSSLDSLTTLVGFCMSAVNGIVIVCSAVADSAELLVGETADFLFVRFCKVNVARCLSYL